MLRILLDELSNLAGWRPVCVIGHDRAAVKAMLPPGIGTVVQWPPRGTGDAVRKSLGSIRGGRLVVVMPADAPLVTADTLQRLIREHVRRNALATVLTAEPPEPGSYGRVVETGQGNVLRIVEALDADPETLRIRRINTGIYVFDTKALLDVIARIGRSNRKGEFYLTDAIELIARKGTVASVRAGDAGEVAGINTLADLARAEGVLQKRLRGKLLENGVRIPHPQSVYLEPGVRVESGAQILPGSHLAGKTTVAAGAVIGPFSYITDSRIGPGAKVWYSVVEESVVESKAVVGPFAHVRPKSRIGPGAKIGNFVETKASRIGRDARVSHLAYVGDTTVGDAANIGAGTITCNFDGIKKSSTRIGRRAFIGSNTALVAPVSVGDGAVIGAGSVITKNVPAHSLALTRSPQVMRPGWTKRRKAR